MRSRPRLLGPLGRRAAAGSLAVALASIAVLSGVTLFLLDLDIGNAGHQQERAYPTSAVVSALRSAYLAENGWAEADWEPVITLAHLEGVGLSLKAGGRVLLQVPPVPRPAAAASLPARWGDARSVMCWWSARPRGSCPPKSA